jgi:hypothetical protein
MVMQYSRGVAHCFFPLFFFAFFLYFKILQVMFMAQRLTDSLGWLMTHALRTAQVSILFVFALVVDLQTHTKGNVWFLCETLNPPPSFHRALSGALSGPDIFLHGLCRTMQGLKNLCKKTRKTGARQSSMVVYLVSHGFLCLGGILQRESPLAFYG